EWLLNEVDSTSLHRLDRERHVAVTGDDNSRQARRAFLEAAQELDTCDLRHAHIGDEATALRGVKAVEESLRRSVQTHGKPRGAQHESERLAYGFVVIDDMDHR